MGSEKLPRPIVFSDYGGLDLGAVVDFVHARIEEIRRRDRADLPGGNIPLFFLRPPARPVAGGESKGDVR